MKKITKSLIVTMIIVFAAPSWGAEKLSVMLDWFPNVDHLPLYVAQGLGYFDEAGLDVEIISPSETSDSLKLAMSGAVDIAVGYQPQTIMAAAEGLELRVIGRLVGYPLTTLLFLDGKGIEKTSDLEGKTVGYTVPGMMDLLMAAFAKGNGIKEYNAVNVGFTIVPALVSGQVDAVMGPFKTYEVVSMAHQGIKASYFELEKHGIPTYDELIFLTSPKTLEGKRMAITAFADSVQRAIDFARENKEAALDLYFKALPEADREMERDAFAATLPFFVDGQSSDPAKWSAFAKFAHESGLIKTRLDPSGLIAR